MLQGHLIQAQFLDPAVNGVQSVWIGVHVYLLQRDCGKEGKRRENVTHTGSRVYLRRFRLTCYVLAPAESVIDGAKAAEHGSCPYPHHRNGVSGDKQSETVPTSSQ